MFDGLFGKRKKRGGHGRHWQRYFESPESGHDYFSSLTTHPAVGEIVGDDARGLVYRDGSLRTIVLLGPDGSCWSFYPYYRGAEYRVTITEVVEWSNDLEGQIHGYLPDGLGVGFFDTLYFANKRKYQVGQTYNFSLAAQAYRIRVVPPGSRPNFVDDARLLMPAKDGDTDDYWFSGPVQSIELIGEGQTAYYLIRVSLPVQSSIVHPDLVLYVPINALRGNHAPQVGDELEGAFWWQGSLLVER